MIQDYLYPNPIIIYKNINFNTFEPIPLVYKNIKPFYLISPFGDIYSIIKHKVLKQDTNFAGYKRVCLITENGKLNFFCSSISSYYVYSKSFS